MFEATTILGYRSEGKAVIGGDGQVTFGDTVLKGNATKIRTLHEGKVLAGFAGSTADAFNLFDMFESILAEKRGDLFKSVIGFSKMWRKDKHLRQLEAMMIVLNQEHIFILSGNGDVVEPEDGKIAAIGSGGNYAISMLSQQRALWINIQILIQEHWCKSHLRLQANFVSIRIRILKY